MCVCDMMWIQSTYIRHNSLQWFRSLWDHPLHYCLCCVLLVYCWLDSETRKEGDSVTALQWEREKEGESRERKEMTYKLDKLQRALQLWCNASQRRFPPKQTRQMTATIRPKWVLFKCVLFEDKFLSMCKQQPLHTTSRQLPKTRPTWPTFPIANSFALLYFVCVCVCHCNVSTCSLSKRKYIHFNCAKITFCAQHSDVCARP